MRYVQSKWNRQRIRQNLKDDFHPICRFPARFDFLNKYQDIILKHCNILRMNISLQSLVTKSIEEVDYAVLENTGTLSVFQKTKDYPLPIILDGVIDYDVLKEIKKDTVWIYKLLEKKNLELKDIFYAFYTKDKTYIIKKSDLI